MRTRAGDLALLKELSVRLGARAKTLSKFRGQVTNLTREAEKEVNQAGFMERIIEARFKAEGETPQGPRWKERLDDEPHPILHKTGALMMAAMAAVRNKFKAIKGKQLWRISMNSLGYGYYHQVTGVGKAMTRRKFFNPPTEAELAPAWAFFRKAIIRKFKAALGIGR